MVLFRQPNILHGDQVILDDIERELVLNLLDAKPGSRLVLNDESFDLEMIRPFTIKVYLFSS